MKKILIIFILFFLLRINVFAENSNDDFIMKVQKNILIDTNLSIDLTSIYDRLKKRYKSNILFEYNIQNEQTINSPKIEKKFKTFGRKEINLNIYKKIGYKKELLLNKKIEIFVYKQKISFIVDKNMKDKFLEFNSKARELGVLIDFSFINLNKIQYFNFKKEILYDIDQNYLGIWGTKDFIFDILSKINNEHIDKKLDIVGISPFNINILQNYLEIFLNNKKWLHKGILLDEASRFEIFKAPLNINNLIKILTEDKYDYVVLNMDKKINNIFFISKFINNLSNLGFSTQNIYIILIIPFLFLGIIIFKHLIGISTAGILVPIAFTLLFFRLGFLVNIMFFIIFIVLNLILSKIISKYSLHYTPKIVTLIIINILVMIIVNNILLDYHFIDININDIMLYFFFIIISERLINIIVSKNFFEYKTSILNTIIFSILSFLFFSIPVIRTIILTYPETIIFLIPVSFLIGKFTGLRVTEYFRFKELIKSIEE